MGPFTNYVMYFSRFFTTYLPVVINSYILATTYLPITLYLPLTSPLTMYRGFPIAQIFGHKTGLLNPQSPSFGHYTVLHITIFGKSGPLFNKLMKYLKKRPYGKLQALINLVFYNVIFD